MSTLSRKNIYTGYCFGFSLIGLEIENQSLMNHVFLSPVVIYSSLLILMSETEYEPYQSSM